MDHIKRRTRYVALLLYDFACCASSWVRWTTHQEVRKKLHKNRCSHNIYSSSRPARYKKLALSGRQAARSGGVGRGGDVLITSYILYIAVPYVERARKNTPRDEIQIQVSPKLLTWHAERKQRRKQRRWGDLHTVFIYYLPSDNVQGVIHSK